MAQRCDDTGESLASGMAQLIQRIESLNGGAFAGQANTAFQGVSQELNDGLRKIISALDELASKISSAGSTFTQHDGDAAQQIRHAASLEGGNVTSVLNGSV